MTFSPARHPYPRLSLLPVLLLMMACGESNRTPAGPSPADGIRDSAALFQLITQTDPLTEYTLFPNVEEFTVGRLNGSEAHRQIVRVSMNARALGALQSGRLPTAAQFPDGSIILKEVRPRADAPATVYAVMYKDAGNTLAGDGWCGPSLPRMVRSRIPYRTEGQPVRVAINGSKGRRTISSARSNGNADE